MSVLQIIDRTDILMLKTKLELGLKGLYQSKTFYNAFFNET